MFLMQKNTHDLVEVLSMSDLFNPFAKAVVAQIHAGEELQDPEAFLKAELIFPSGEDLPRCWIDPEYRNLKQKPPTMALAH